MNDKYNEVEMDGKGVEYSYPFTTSSSSSSGMPMPSAPMSGIYSNAVPVTPYYPTQQIPNVQSMEYYSSYGGGHRQKLYTVNYDGEDIDIFSEDILENIPIDKDIWEKYQKGIRRNAPCVEGWKLVGHICCVPPWILHMIVFAPCTWCGPCSYHLLCKRPEILEVPTGSQDALVFTKYGVHCHHSTIAQQRIGIKWQNLDMEKIQTASGKDVEGLGVMIGFGLLLPCYMHKFNFCADVDGVYSVTLHSMVQLGPEPHVIKNVTGLGLGVREFESKLRDYHTRYR